jgi:hypothetical protein
MLELTDADGFNPEDGRHDLVVLAITRTEIEHSRWPSALERLLRITDNAQAARSMQGRLLFMVQGYDDDRRILGEIAEVRSYMISLTDAWPFWVTFLAPQEEVISPLLGLLVGLRRAGAPGQYEVDLERSEVVIARLVAAHRQISSGLGLPNAKLVEDRFLALCRRIGWLAA